MSEYDFLILSSEEFELFCKDILEIELGIKLENFKAGKDGGIDLRYAPSDDDTLIVQCKRYKDYSSLISTLKKEVVKVKKLNPDRYILMTSVSLNPNEKDYIKKLFEGFIKSTGDIYGKDELQTILGNHHSIERKHYKLWLASTNVLSTILHSDVFNRSKFTEEQIKEKVSLYVPNESFDIALKHLEKNKVIVLSGGPGVGKTTLADMLYLKYSAQGYEFIEISDDINEGDRLFNPEVKQLFYYDDFLGRNFLSNKLSKNEDRRIINFIKKVMKFDNKIYIMTTREYILNQAQISYELLEDRSIDINKFILNVENFTKNVRARILYNHLFFSRLPNELIESLVKVKAYKNIISHPNYNPRLIHRMTSELYYKEVSSIDYPQIFIQELDYPYHIWQHIFENQINEYSRWILYLLMIMGDRPVTLLKLEINFISLNEYLGRPFDSVSFKLGLKELERTFITINKDRNSQEIVWFQNPSIADFLIQYSSDNINLLDLWNSTKYFFPMFDIFSFTNMQGKIAVSGQLKNEYFNTIINRFCDFLDCKTLGDKILAINKLERYIDFDDGKAKQILMDTIKILEVDFLDEYADYSEEYVEFLIDYKNIITAEINISNIFTQMIDNIEYYNEFISLISLYDAYTDEFNKILDEETKRKIIDNVMDDIKDYLEEYDFDEVIGYMDEYGSKFKVDVNENLNEITQRHYDNLEEFPYDYDKQKIRNQIDDSGDTSDYIDNLFESLLCK